jgi:phosphoribosyl-dephospho-CoA transferase
MISLLSGAAIEEVAQLEIIHSAALARFNELDVLYSEGNAINRKLGVSAYFSDIQCRCTPCRIV